LQHAFDAAEEGRQQDVTEKERPGA
jgi:hypothetical protein